MMYASADSAGPGGTGDPLSLLRRAVAHDTLALAVLHNSEITAETVDRLHDNPNNPLGLQLDLVSERGQEALALFSEGVRQIQREPEDAELDELAADYAGIYLTHALRASPYESVWIDEEGLAMQEPMFQIRGFYERHGLRVQDWRKRSDDHLVLQLQFISHLMSNDAELTEVAVFLDEHLLRWIDEFAVRVASRCATAFYAGLGAITAAYLDEFRELLAEILDQAVPTREEIDKRMRPVSETTLPDPAFVPGSAPSW